MKVISIYQENGQKIELKDDDNTKKEIYIKKLTPLLSPDNSIIILSTSFESILLRPSKITSIYVTEEFPPDKIKEEEIIEDIVTDKVKEEKIEEPKEEEKKKEV